MKKRIVMTGEVIMDNMEIIKCRKCGSELDENKSKYKRNDFNFKWHYCKVCKCYNAYDNNEAFLTIGYSEEMDWEFFDRGFRMRFLKEQVRELDSSLAESKPYFDNLTEIKAGKGNITCHKSRYEDITYRISFDEKSDGLIMVGRYGDTPKVRYNKLEEELKKLVYDFYEIDAQRRNKELGMVMSWKRLAEEVNMTEPELKLILKNKTVRKLNAREIWLLSHWCGCKICGYGWKEIDDSPWSK